MAVSIHFVLKDKKSDSPTPIYTRFKTKGKRFVWSLGRDRMIHPDLWNPDVQAPIQTRYTNTEAERNKVRYLLSSHEKENPDLKTDLENITNRIEAVRSEIKTYIANQEAKGEHLDYDELKEQLNDKYTPHKKSRQEAREGLHTEFITEFYESFVQGITTGDILKDSGKSSGQRFGAGTIKVYNTSLRQWKLFEKTTGKRFRWTDFNNDLYYRFIQYCNKENLSANYTGKLVKNVKVILRRAYDRGIHHNPCFREKYFQVTQVEVKKIALSQNEVDAIRTCDLTEAPERYELYRDVFLIGVYTAQRYSDFSAIRPEHVKGDYIDMITRKTKTRIKIPIHHHIRPILEKYGNRIPRTHPQHMNEIMKDIGRMAGIDEPIEYEKVKGGKVVRGTLPKYKMIETHTARRTGATLMYLSMKDPYAVMKITGHQTEKNLLRYIKIDVDQNAEAIRESSFFKPLRKVQ